MASAWINRQLLVLIFSIFLIGFLGENTTTAIVAPPAETTSDSPRTDLAVSPTTSSPEVIDGSTTSTELTVSTPTVQATPTADGSTTEPPAASTPSVVNGGWGSYRNVSGCSTSCGVGVYTRERSCTNPAPGPNGNLCIKADGTRGTNETVQADCLGVNESCSLTYEQSLYSLYIEFVFNETITRGQFVTYMIPILRNSFKDVLNQFCDSEYLSCCNRSPGSGRRNTTTSLAFINSNNIGFGADTPRIAGKYIWISFFVTPNATNDLCNDIISISRRKRRDAVAGSSSLSKEVLYSAFSRERLNNLTATRLTAELAADNIFFVSIGNILLANVTVTSTAAPATPPPQTDDSWVIPVAVCLSLLAVGLIVFLIVWFVVLPMKKSENAVEPVE